MCRRHQTLPPRLFVTTGKGGKEGAVSPFHRTLLPTSPLRTEKEGKARAATPLPRGMCAGMQGGTACLRMLGGLPGQAPGSKALFASLKKQVETLFWLICYERKTLFRLKKQIEKYEL